jgi:hypothetical protein
MNIWVPLFLFVMPLSIGSGSVLFVVVAMSMMAFVCIHISRPRESSRAVTTELDPVVQADASTTRRMRASRAEWIAGA